MLILKTPFGSGVQKMVEEYEDLAGFQIASFEYIVKGHDSDGNLKLDFIIHLAPATQV